MDKQDAMKWVEALRSGEYKQGTCRLYTKETNSYCCLGVLNKIMSKKYTAIDREATLDKTIHFNDPFGLMKTLETDLVGLNDSGFWGDEGSGHKADPLNFNEIADIIQINYEEL